MSTRQLATTALATALLAADLLGSSARILAKRYRMAKLIAATVFDDKLT